MLFGLVPLAVATTDVTTGHVSSLYESFLHSAGPDSLFGAENLSRWSDPEVDAMIEQAASEASSDVREKLLLAVRDRALRELPYVPLYSPDQAYGVGAGVEFVPRLDRAVFAADVSRRGR
jgi:peptide/nickel transport system substrate-binding protein